MTSCFSFAVETPEHIILKGLWFGPEHPERAIIIVHGLGSTVFSNHNLFLPLVNNTTAVIFFNNRGHDFVTHVRKMDPSAERGFVPVLAGAAHEVFTDCADDIEGVVQFVKSQNVPHITLAGHSTGCQKSVYYITRPGNAHKVDNIVLLSPVSDYAGMSVLQTPENAKKSLAFAKKMVKAGKPHALLPYELSEEPCDAQRYLSLYTPDSVEEIFSYAQPKKKPELLEQVSVPTLVLLAEKDEYWDRPVQQVEEWFEKHVKVPHTITMIKDAGHSYTEHEEEVAQVFTKFFSA